MRDFQKAAARIERMRKRTPKAVGSGLRIIAEEIMTDVKASRPGAGVPKDTGALASTGRVEGPNTLNQVELSFGGAAAPYALRQHEEMSYSHPLGEAQYLVRGVERWRANGVSVDRALNAILREIEE